MALLMDIADSSLDDILLQQESEFKILIQILRYGFGNIKRTGLGTYMPVTISVRTLWWHLEYYDRLCTSLGYVYFQ